MTEYFPDENEDEEATLIVSSFKILEGKAIVIVASTNKGTAGEVFFE